MKTLTTISLSSLSVVTMAAILVATGGPSVCRAETIWTGSNTNFTQGSAADVLIAGAVAIKRQPGSYLYNPFVDTFGPTTGTPSDTEWAFGTMANHLTLEYEPFSQIRADGQAAVGHLGPYIVGKQMVMHLINEDIYISVMFTAWPQFGGSTFSYTRSTPAAVAPPPTPTVSITSPTNSPVFAAPADVAIVANASVSSGTVTNVMFFRDSTLIGSKQSSPFTITASGLVAGNYGLKAVATAAGISATSSVVNISVVTPVNTSLTAPTATGNNQFTFSYSSTPGLRYEIDVSSNLLTWKSVATNTATGNPSFFTNPISGEGNYYRVGRLPNP
jgi:hypothetical protein